MSEFNFDPECAPELEAELRRVRPAKAPERLRALISRDLSTTANLDLSSVTAARDAQPLAVRIPTSGLLVRPERTRRVQVGLWWQRLMWAGAGAAVAAAVLLMSNRADVNGPKISLAQAGPTPAEVDQAMLFEPVDAAREVIASEDGGVVYDEATGASQIVRYSSMERHSWANAAGALVEVEFPREDLLMIPVAYH